MNPYKIYGYHSRYGHVTFIGHGFRLMVEQNVSSLQGRFDCARCPMVRALDTIFTVPQRNQNTKSYEYGPKIISIEARNLWNSIYF